MALFIVHPNIDPAEISTALGLQGHFQQKQGDARSTPKGNVIGGVYRDSRWRHVTRHESKQHFAVFLSEFVSSLATHKNYFANLLSDDASIQIVVSFLGDGYYGDKIPRSVLAQIAELGMDLGIEVFAARQT